MMHMIRFTLRVFHHVSSISTRRSVLLTKTKQVVTLSDRRVARDTGDDDLTHCKYL